MKYLLTLSIAITSSILTQPTSGCCKKSDTFIQATEQFKIMRVSKIRRLDIKSLNTEQLSAFKALAQSIFIREIASADCFSQANIRKYEVMYQKIGELDAMSHTL